MFYVSYPILSYLQCTNASSKPPLPNNIVLASGAPIVSHALS
jgi:hypothetical protein